MQDKRKWVAIDYTNWRGERRTRIIYPASIFFGKNEWHKEDQWLLDAFCQEGGLHRTFALNNVHSWKPAGDL